MSSSTSVAGAGVGIRIEKLSFRIGEFELKDVSLEVAEGEYFVLTGPNGAGKTMLMRLIAGLETPDAGEIFIAGERATPVPPWERPIGYVPQDVALFPHRNVERNVAFGLEVRKLDRDQIAKEVGEAAELLGISRLLKRTTGGLSGGEKQKVSLARALVLEPAVLLLDEPVSAIDEADRDRLCGELKDIQRRTGVTTIHVAHNRREADLVADRVGVLEDGAVRIVGDGGAAEERPGPAEGEGDHASLLLS
ncbi:MAG: ABC transporter ATP-binding protein [Planctomycetota bacterium]